MVTKSEDKQPTESSTKARYLDRRQKESWHVDKQVPLALILALVVQFVGLVLYMGALANRTGENERRITLLEAQRISERLATLESQLGDTKALLLRVDTKIDRLANK